MPMCAERTQRDLRLGHTSEPQRTQTREMSSALLPHNRSSSAFYVDELFVLSHLTDLHASIERLRIQGVRVCFTWRGGRFGTKKSEVQILSARLGTSYSLNAGSGVPTGGRWCDRVPRK